MNSGNINKKSENIFDFIVNGETLRQWMTRHIHDGKGQWAGEVTRQVVRNVKEEMMEVEMAISASQNEQRPIITAILRLDTNKTR